MKTWQKILIVGVVSGAAYCWGQRSQRDELDELRSSVRSVSRSLDDTNRAVARTAGAQLREAAPRRAEPAVGAAAAAASPPVADADAEAAGQAPPGQAAKPATIDPATLRAHLGSAFDREAIDAAWSGTASLSVQRKLAAVMPASALRSVQCKETMCRIEMVYDDVAQYQATLRQMTPEALPWNATLFSSAVSDPAEKPVTFVAFLSREGRELAIE